MSTILIEFILSNCNGAPPVCGRSLRDERKGMLSASKCVRNSRSLKTILSAAPFAIARCPTNVSEADTTRKSSWRVTGGPLCLFEMEPGETTMFPGLRRAL